MSAPLLFPLLFFWLMAPLPGPLLNDATLHAQMTSTVLADKILHLMTFSTHLDGKVIHMEDYSLFVDVPCSGFKLLLALLTFSAAFAYLVDGKPARRLALFLFSLPLSLAVNSVRIALIGVVGECVGPDAAHVFHDWSGMITLVARFYRPVWAGKRIGMPHIRRMGYLLTLLIGAALATAMAWKPAPPPRFAGIAGADVPRSSGRLPGAAG